MTRLIKSGILGLLILLSVSNVEGANSYKTRQNPWTSKLDYVLDTTSLEVGSLTASSTVTGITVSATTSLMVGSDEITDITGSGLSIVGGALTSTATGAPSTADYLVGTTNGSLSAEIVVGATPNGDLGGTWDNISVDDESHAHTTTTISGVDISADTNLTAGDNLTLTDDDLDLDANISVTSVTASSTVSGVVVDTDYIDSTGTLAILDPVSISGGALDMNSNLINNVLDPTSAQDVATKAYVDNQVASIERSYFFSNDDLSPDVGAYKSMAITEDTAGTVASPDVTGSIGSPTTMFTWLTPANSPGLDRFVVGNYETHIHLYKVSTGNLIIKFYYEIWRTDSSGVDIEKLGTSDTINSLTTVEAVYTLQTIISTETALDTTDRLAIRFYGYEFSGTGTSIVTMVTGGTADSHFSLRVEPAQLNEVYVRQDGTKALTADWNVGAFDLTAVDMTSTNQVSGVTVIATDATIYEDLTVGGDITVTDITVTPGNLTVGGTLTTTGAISGPNVTTGANPGHTHTTTSLSGIDIGDDTNLAGTANEIVLTGDTLSLTLAKDIVATSPLTVNATTNVDNVLIGADSDITFAIGDIALTTNTSGNYVTDVTAGVGLSKTSSAGEGQTVDLAVATTEIEATTWGAGGNASNIWTFNLSGTDHTMTAGSGLMTFSGAVTSSGTITSSGTFDATGAVGLVLGSGDITSFTVTTDGSGNAEFTLPNDVIGDADIDWGTGAGQVSGADITFAEGDMTDSTIVSADIKNGTVTLADTTITAGRSLTIATDDIAADAECYTFFKAMTIETPTDADNFFFFEAPVAMTITRVQAIVEAATSAVITLQECDSAGDNAATIESVTADVDGVISTSIDNGAIDAGDIVRVDVGTVTGTVGQVSVTCTGTLDD